MRRAVQVAMARPRRLAAFGYLGYFAYSLTFCTIRRQRLFAEKPAVALVLGQILRTAGERQFELLAYCFMPDHLHLLVQGVAEDAHLPSFARLVRQRTAVDFRRRFGAALWQPGYCEHALRRCEDMLATAQYIANNPVRAGLAPTPAAWPFTGGKLLPRAVLETFPVPK